MKTLLKGLSAGVFSLASWSAIAIAPVFAGSINNVTIGGSAPNDYLVFNADATNTFLVSNTLANVQNVLDGNAISPTGNVELGASSEQPNFDFTKNTTLQGTIGGKSITLSSLTASDWSVIGTTWFNAALTAYGLGGLPNNIKSFAFSQFASNGGFQKFSDPNISYVNQNDNTGEISIGLAGYLDATQLLLSVLPDSFKPFLTGKTLQASELVKYDYDGQSGYLYSFNATNSGLVAVDDGVSHTGNYEVYIQGSRPVPVPAAFLGIALAGAMGAGMLKRRQLNR